MPTIRMGLVRPLASALCLVLLFSIASFADDTRGILALADDDSFRPLVFQTTAHRAGDIALNAASTSDAGVNVDVDVEPLLTSSELTDASEWLDGSDAALAGDGCCDPGDRPGLFGCLWHGGDAITAEYIYTGEVFNNMRGGISTTGATAYTGRFDLVLSAELCELGLPPGGRLLFHFQTLHGEGIKIGPDLTTADRKNRDALLINILDPSGTIRPEFISQTALLNDGRVLTGLVIESSADQITFVDAKQQKTTVARDEIDQLHPSETSLMPEGVLETLQPQEIRDLFSYLESDRLPVQSARKK